MAFHKNFLKPTLITLSWVPVYITVTNHVCFVGKIKGRSMEPTLQDQDWVLVWKWNNHKVANYTQGDIVFFKSPMDPKIVFCKRVKGVQYDSVRPKDQMPDPSDLSDPNTSAAPVRSLVHIPRNHLWCEGDNVFHSVDSNKFGPISTGLCIGKVTSVIWPPSRWAADFNEYQGRGDIRFKR